MDVRDTARHGSQIQHHIAKPVGSNQRHLPSCVSFNCTNLVLPLSKCEVTHTPELLEIKGTSTEDKNLLERLEDAMLEISQKTE